MKKIKKVLVYRGYLFDGGIFNKGGDTGEEGRKELLYSLTEYHPDFDKPVLEQQFAMDEHIEQQTEFTYDAHGFLIREVIKEGDGEVIEEKSYEADQQQRIKRSFRHYADGSFDTTEHFYDESGHLIKKLSHDDEGLPEKTEVFEYENDKLVREAVYDADDDISLEILYSYDEDGLLDSLKETNYDDGDVRRQEFLYNDHGQREALLTYDGEDNLIERYMFTLDEKGRATQTIEENKHKKNTVNTEYDDRGNVVLHEERDMQGTLVSRMARSFDDENRIIGSEILTSMPHRGQLEYTVRFAYEFFD